MCEVWFHAKCDATDLQMYEVLGNSSLTWMCSKCGFPNFADSFFNDSIDSLSSSDSLSPPQDTPTDSGTPPQNVHSTYHENNNKYI